MIKKKGFTLIELLVVIGIIALLLSIVLPSLKKVKAKARQLVCKSNLRSIHTALIMYAEDNNDKVTDPLGDTTTPDARPNPYVQWKGYDYDRWCRKWYLRLYDYLETPEVYVCPAWRLIDGENFIAYAVGEEIFYVTYTANEYFVSGRELENAAGVRARRDWRYTELVHQTVANNPIALLFADGIYEVNGWNQWRSTELNPATSPTDLPGGRASYRHDGQANFLCADGRIGSLEMEEVDDWDKNDFKPSTLK